MTGKDKTRRSRLILLFGLIVLAIIVWILYWVVLDCFIPTQAQSRSEFGDKFGGVAALFSALAFAGLIYTVILQREELALQREELEKTRDELKGQKEQLEAQNKTLRQQRFEHSFFELLKLYASLVENLTLIERGKASTPKSQGREAIRRMNEIIKGDFNNFNRTPNSPPSETINRAFLGFFGRYESDVGYYLRTLYNILKFIDRSDVENKEFYTNLLRAQLSLQELILLFYNCLSEKGSEKFKPLVEKYALLKELDERRLFDKSHKGLYDPQAFGVSPLSETAGSPLERG